MQSDIDKILIKLSKSRFRSSFKLNDKDKEYIKKNGISVIYNHSNDFILKRIASQTIKNDGKQTPTKGHPVFIAQHATATCCMSCLYKWYKFPKNVELTSYQVSYIVTLIMEWIKLQMYTKD